MQEKYKEPTKMIKILRASEIAFFLVIMALLFVMPLNHSDGYGFIRIFGLTFNIMDVICYSYTLWLIFVGWVDGKYKPRKNAKIWNIALAITAGCLVIWRILYAANP